MAGAPPSPPPSAMDPAGVGRPRPSSAAARVAHKFEMFTRLSAAATIDPARPLSFNHPSPVAQRSTTADREAAPQACPRWSHRRRGRTS